MQKSIFLLTLLTTITLNALSTKELAVTINLSGKQRMLTQKMTKEALLIKNGINKDENIKKLSYTTKLFDKTLKGLIGGDSQLKLKNVKNPEIIKDLKQIQTIWYSLYSDIKKGNYKSLIKNNEPLLKKCDKVVRSYTKLVKSKASKRAQSVNLCGKERMLTQKIAKDILLGSKDKLKADKKLFEKILNGLLHSDKELNLEATKLPKIKKALKAVKKEYKNITLKKHDIKKLDQLLINIDKIVKRYEISINKENKALNLSSIVANFMDKKEQDNHIINLAGRQRMLTQKMSKDALIINTNPHIKDELIKSYKLYDKTLSALLSGDLTLNLPVCRDKDIKDEIKKLQKVWKPFKVSIKKVLSGSDKDLDYIIKNNLQLLTLSNTLVKSLKNSKKTDYLQKARLDIVDIAGRQRMLTQKMTKEKFLILRGIDTSKNLKRLKNTVALFENSLELLIHGDKTKSIPKPTEKSIKKAFSKVNTLWLEIKPYYKKEVLNKKEIKMLNKKSNKLLKTMDKAVKLCESARDY